MSGNTRFTNAINFSLAYVLSAFGYEFLFFVMTVYIYELTGSAMNVGLFTALTFVPKLFSPYYGSLADRYPRALLFFIACLCTAGSILAINTNAALGWIYAIWFFISILSMVIMNVRTTIMTEVMPKDNYLRGNSVMLMSLNFAKLLAPVMGGVIAIQWDPQWVLYLASSVYVIAAILGLATKLNPLPKDAKRSPASALSHMREGLRFLAAHSDLSYLGFVAFLWRLWTGLQLSLFVVYVDQFLGGAGTQYGIFMAMIGVGSLIGSGVGPWVARTFEPKKVVLRGLSLYYLMLIAVGLIPVFEIALAIITVAQAIFFATVVSIHSVRDNATPVEYRGRVYGCITAIVTPPALVSMLLGSYLAEPFGAANVIVGSAVLGFLSLFMVHAWFTNKTKHAQQAFEEI